MGPEEGRAWPTSKTRSFPRHDRQVGELRAAATSILKGATLLNIARFPFNGPGFKLEFSQGYRQLAAYTVIERSLFLLLQFTGRKKQPRAAIQGYLTGVRKGSYFAIYKIMRNK